MGNFDFSLFKVAHELYLNRYTMKQAERLKSRERRAKVDRLDGQSA